MLRASWVNIDKILSNAFLILTSMILSFLILDYTASFFLETRSPFEQLYPVGKTRTPTPFIMSKGVPGTEFWDGSRNNELGYRGRSAAEADDDDFLVFVLGGSTVFSGAPPISDLLESRIQVAGHTNIKVLNYGVPSSNSGMELARLVYEVANFRPDMIIMYNGGNDLLHPLQWDPRPGYPFNFIAFERNPLLEEFRNYDTLTMMLLGSSIGRYTISRVARSSMNDFLRLPELREEVDWNTDVWREAIVKKYLENMMKAQAIAMAFNSKFYVFFQPLKAYAPPPGVSISDHDHFLTARKFLRREVAANFSALHFHDLSDIFVDAEGQVFADMIHISQESKLIVVEKVFSIIRNNLPR
jgi:hypothetical protein